MNSDIDEWQYQSNVFLVRHATSEFNLVFQCLLENNATVEEIVKEGSDIKYRDCSLADVGIKEWEEMLKSIKDLNVYTVFISPLLRSVQTAYHLFKGHPKFESIRFVIVPKAREALIAMDDILKFD